jgi:F-type H+-transporting ATPase subunit delta
VNGLLDEGRARQVVRRILEARRRDSLKLLSRFLYLAKLDRVRHTAEIESAMPLADDLTSGIKDGLLRSYGPGMTALFSQNPALIGGMRIRVGSDVYDGSVRAALAALEKSF